MTAGNVLFITVDQWRGDCLSVAGHPVVRTPTLDALADRGVRFANHWSVTAPCGPSRASLLTGLYLMNHRSVGNGTPLDDRFDNLARVARRHGYDPTLFGYTDTTVDPRTVTDPDDPRLRDYEGVLPGFREGTVLTGANVEPWLRWLEANGIDVPSNPKRLFDPIPGYPGADDHAPSWAPGLVPAHLTETAFLTREVCDWLDRRDGEPWFAHVSYLRPHPPYRAPEGYHDRYDAADGDPFRRLADRAAELAMHPLHAGIAHVTGCALEEAEARQVRATYWGNMAEVDDQLAVLFAHLEATGHADDTLIVLTSDHGDQMGDHWLVEKAGWWDESYHVPLIVVDPRRDADATRATAVDVFTESVDVLPTICEWIGAEVPVAADGRPLQPFLHGAGAPDDWRDAAHWQWDFRDPVDHVGEDVFGLTMEQCCLDVRRTATEKYVRFGDGSSLLFDLREDPFGLVDRASDPDAAGDRLAHAEALLTWRQRHDDRTLTGHLATRDGMVERRDPRR